MFLRFLRDRMSWIFFIIFVLGAIDLLLWLDPGIDVAASSILYMNALVIVSLVCFILWRYFKETAYVKELASMDETNGMAWVEALPDAGFKQEEIINDLLIEKGMQFAGQLEEVRKNSMIQVDYTAAWVHEAKAPLTAMKLIIDSNRDMPAASRIEAEWLRIYLLIDQQLYISRLPTLESDYALEEVELKELVSAEIRELMSWCLEKNVEVEMDGLEQSVITDRKWSRFALRQILSNAVKYSPDSGTIAISVRTAESGHTVLIVKDQGPGIAPHDLPRIFDKGFTGSNGRIQNAATGLGLYLAKMVAEKIGIQLNAKSELAKGTTMELAFSMENEFDHIRK
ncbi:sensor histidine kinase [Planococcus ruber]|uniref:sensor histidine kinase n=1 Tax=Planococcus ruber TaxID=2027871 RepID=UPI001FEDB87B|nr:sensor histidine kinase [Planococcus ruber]MCJ1907509.1 sensor histidine kinase [Planococcus ruber]